MLRSSEVVSQAEALGLPDIHKQSNPVGLPASAILPPSPLDATDFDIQDKAEPLPLSREDTTPRHSDGFQSEEEAVSDEGSVQV